MNTSNPQSSITLSPGEVHIWIAQDKNCRDQSLLEKYRQLMNEEETARQARFYFENNRHQYLVSRALIRSVLSLYHKEISADEWVFTKNRYGKPYIANSSLKHPLQFNVSHTENMIVLAVTTDQEIGVDVECLLREGKTTEIAENFFSPLETEQLIRLPESQQTDRFFDLWTLKEAYIKACGMGLSIPLDHFSYRFPQQNQITITFSPERDDQPDYWEFWQFHPSESHKIAIALKKERPETRHLVSIRQITPLSEISEIKLLDSMQGVKTSIPAN